jgi:CheY-like chemotaxis protein
VVERPDGGTRTSNYNFLQHFRGPALMCAFIRAAFPAAVARYLSMAVVLIVEDDGFTRELAEMVVQDWGYDVLSAGDVGEALTFLKSSRRIDVLFTDIYLKAAVLGGCDLAREAIQLRPNLRVLYTTGNAITKQMKSLFVEGTHCLRKPYTPEQLHDFVDGLLAA